MTESVSHPPASSLRLAVIVRTKDRPSLLDRCLASLVKQSRQPDQVIVVNDGGVAIDDLLKGLSKLPIMLLENKTSQGRAKAGNQGVEASDGDLICFLDDDDSFAPDHLERLEQTIKHFDAQVAYSGCRLLQRDMLGKKEPLQETSVGVFNDAFDEERLYYENYIPLINLLIRRDLFLEVGGFDTNFDLFEDWDLLLRLAEKTRFYHLNKITTDYALWGEQQITRTSSQAKWQQAYEQILAKHLLALPAEQQRARLVDYWMLSQERRGIVRQDQRELQNLQLKLAEKEQALLQAQHDHANQIAIEQAAHTDALSQSEQKIIALKQQQEAMQGQYEDKISEWTKQVESQKAEILRLQDELKSTHNRYAEQAQGHTKLQQAYERALNDFQQSNARVEALEQQAARLSSELAAGLDKPAFEAALLAEPRAYDLAKNDVPVHSDYQHLLTWIRQKVEQLDLYTPPSPQTIDLSPAYEEMVSEVEGLIARLGASMWPQVRRHVPASKAILQQLANFKQQAENPAPTSEHNLLQRYNLEGVLSQRPHYPQPPLRPLSGLYPTYMLVAGDNDNPSFMENTSTLGETPFFLTSPEDVLVFSVYSSLANFCRLDLLMATCMRVNPCQVRCLIRDMQTGSVIREVIFDGIDVYDNRYHSICFEPIADSVQKSFQIEIDSPNASADNGIALWCHQKLPVYEHPQNPDEHHSRQVPQLLPQWVQQSLSQQRLSKRINNDKADIAVVLNGIAFDTSEIALHIALSQWDQALITADCHASILVCGELNPALKQYCQQHDLATADSKDLSAVIHWGQRQTALGSIYHAHISALPHPELVKAAEEMWQEDDNAAMLVPMETDPAGQIRAAYAILVRDAILHHLPIGDSAEAPQHGYRRTVDAASSELIIFKQESLADLETDQLNHYQTPVYQVTELIQQFKNEGKNCLYQSRLRYLHQQAVPQYDPAALESDRKRLFKHWRAHVPQTLAPFARLRELLNPNKTPSVLVIDATLPTYDEDSGSLRMFTLLKLWKSLGYHISFVSDNLDSNPKYRHALENVGIEVFHGQFKLQNAIAQRHFDLALIGRVDVGHRYIPFMRLVSPETMILYDTVDIHYVREERQAEIENNPALAETAKLTKKRELHNCRMADKVLTVTADDGEHLRKEIPDLDYAVLPNVHPHFPLPEQGFDDRDGLVFIGNYHHQPNEDAAEFFVTEVLPKINARLPEAKLYLVGSNMKQKTKDLASENVEIVGWVDEVAPAFAQRKMFVSYLRYGAGMKGKLGQAMSLGLPVVSTTIGAEGMGMVDNETALIADDIDGFVEAVCRLYEDGELWEKLSTQAWQYIEDTYGEPAVKRQLNEILQAL